MAWTFILLGLILVAVGLLWPWIGGLGWGVCQAISSSSARISPDHQRAPNQCGPDAVSLARQPVRLRF